MKLRTTTIHNTIGTVVVPMTTHTLVHDDGTPVTLPEIRQLDRTDQCFGDSDTPSGHIEWVPVCRVRTGLTTEVFRRCSRDDDGAEWMGTDDKGRRIYERLVPAAPFREWLAIDLYTGRPFIAVLGKRSEAEDVEWSVDDETYPALRQYYPITRWPVPEWNDLPLAVLPKHPGAPRGDGGMTPSEILAGIPDNGDGPDAVFRAAEALRNTIDGEVVHFPDTGATA